MAVFRFCFALVSSLLCSCLHSASWPLYDKCSTVSSLYYKGWIHPQPPAETFPHPSFPNLVGTTSTSSPIKTRTCREPETPTRARGQRRPTYRSRLRLSAPSFWRSLHFPPTQPTLVQISCSAWLTTGAGRMPACTATR